MLITCFSFLLLRLLVVITTRSVATSKLTHTSVPSQQRQLHFAILEEAPLGTLIGSLVDELRYVNLGFVELNSNSFVGINTSNGELTVKGRIDRETLCSSEATCCRNQFPIDPSIQTMVLSALQRSTTLASPSGLQLFTDCALKSLVMHENELIEVIIYIGDINDNAPRWSVNMYRLEIPEHVPIGTSYHLPEAVDPDQGGGNTVNDYVMKMANSDAYQTDTNPSKLFRLESQPIGGAINFQENRFDLKLHVEGDLDREQKSDYSLIIHAIDGPSNRMNWANAYQHIPSLPRHTGTLTISIHLTDINDHRPQFSDKYPSIEIAESTAPGSIIFRTEATDNDEDDQNNLVYKISASAGAEVHRCFKLAPDKGELRVDQTLRYANASLLTKNSLQSNWITDHTLPIVGYLIPIEVSDGMHSDSSILLIKLNQVNSYHPQISVGSPWRLSSQKDQLWLNESVKPGTLVAMLSIDDRDQMNQYMHKQSPSTPSCTSGSDIFTIEPLVSLTAPMFKLILDSPLDREQTDQHLVTIECQDNGLPSLTSQFNLRVHVEDANDSPPVFSQQVYTVNVKEGIQPRSVLLKISASDADLGRNAEIRYRIDCPHFTYSHSTGSSNEMVSGSEQSMLSIDQLSGEIVSQVVLDRELIESINCTVEAVNIVDAESNELDYLGHPSRLKSSATVVINIDDVNDCKPRFNSSSYEFAIAEGQQPNIRIGQVFATDCDVDPINRQLRFSIRTDSVPIDRQFQPSRYISINSDGVLFTQSVRLDREQTPVLSFEVEVRDSGRPSLSSYASVLLRLLDVNDNAPSWIYPRPIPAYTQVNVSWHSIVGVIVAQLKAVDKDEGSNGQIVYSILHGNEEAYFELIEDTGVVHLAKSLSNLATGLSTGRNVSQPSLVKRLFFKASDRGTPMRFNTTALNILIVPYTQNIDNWNARPNYFDRHTLNLTERHVDNDLIIMVILITLTTAISLILVVAICLIRFRRSARETRMDNGSVGTLPRVQRTGPAEDRSAKMSGEDGWCIDSTLNGKYDTSGETMQSDLCFYKTCSTLPPSTGLNSNHSADTFIPPHESGGEGLSFNAAATASLAGRNSLSSRHVSTTLPYQTAYHGLYHPTNACQTLNETACSCSLCCHDQRSHQCHAAGENNQLHHIEFTPTNYTMLSPASMNRYHHHHHREPMCQRTGDYQLLADTNFIKPVSASTSNTASNTINNKPDHTVSNNHNGIVNEASNNNHECQLLPTQSADNATASSESTHLQHNRRQPGLIDQITPDCFDELFQSPVVEPGGRTLDKSLVQMKTFKSKGYDNIESSKVLAD